MKLKNGRGFYSVEGPNNEEIILDGAIDVSEEVGEYLQENYSGFTVVEGASSGEKPKGSGGEDTDVEICGTEMTDGSICERPVDECPYHD